jgi:hypothetical protein
MDSQTQAEEFNRRGTARLSQGDVASAIADCHQALRFSSRAQAASNRLGMPIFGMAGFAGFT